jgi:hypothetical protein
MTTGAVRSIVMTDVEVLIIELDLQNVQPFERVIKSDILGAHSDNRLYLAFLWLSLTTSLKHISMGEEAILVAAGDQLA